MAESAPLFLFVKTIEKVIGLCIVSIFFKVVILKIGPFFTNLSIESIYLSLQLRQKWSYLQNYHSNFFFNTVHNPITFSIVFKKNVFLNYLSFKIFMNLYSKTFYILNFLKKKKLYGKIYPKLGIYRWV